MCLSNFRQHSDREAEEKGEAVVPFVLGVHRQEGDFVGVGIVESTHHHPEVVVLVRPAHAWLLLFVRHLRERKSWMMARRAVECVGVVDVDQALLLHNDGDDGDGDDDGDDDVSLHHISLLLVVAVR